MSNSFGKIFKISTFGESHGVGLGVVIDGCPPNISISIDEIKRALNRRKTGQSKIVSQRKESENFEILSGIFEGKTTGTPIGIIIKNEDHKSKDYDHIKDVFRPSHADFTYEKKYGIRDYRGGGRSSARETVSRVIAGSIAKQFLDQQTDISIYSYVSKVGKIECNKSYSELDFSKIDSNDVRCPDEKVASEMFNFIDDIRKQGDSVGGVVSCVAKNIPIGLGEPVFDKLHAELGKAMLSINAVKGFEYGSGFEGTEMLGSEHNDEFLSNSKTKTNYSGGIQGGISNGEDIYFNIAFKPVATIMKDQKSIDKFGNEVTVKGKGRHDPCVLPRAVPIVDAMAYLVFADFYLRNKVYS